MRCRAQGDRAARGFGRDLTQAASARILPLQDARAKHFCFAGNSVYPDPMRWTLLALFLLAACGRPLTEAEQGFMAELAGPAFDPAPVRITQNPLIGLTTRSYPARPRSTCRERIFPPPQGDTVTGRTAGIVFFNRLHLREDYALPDYIAREDGAVNLLAQMFFAHEMTHIWQWQNRARTGYYSLTALLGGDAKLAAPFKGGDFATIYLSPRDYHRIHMPLTGKLTDMVYVPGELFSVNPLTAENVPGLFARNERVVAMFDTAIGKVAIVLVGATIVASIETSWAGTVTPPAGKNVTHWQYTDSAGDSITLQKGEEMGLFKLGSTIVVCFEPNRVDLSDLSAGQVTRLGETFATIQNTDTK